MHKQQLTFFFSFCLAATFSDIAHAEVAGIKDGAQMTRAIASKIRTISTLDLQRESERNPELELVDIRTPTEIQDLDGTIMAAQNINIPRGWLEFRTTGHALSKDTPIVVYCGGGIRSPLAACTLQQTGYTNVKNYADGFIGWKNRGCRLNNLEGTGFG